MAIFIGICLSAPLETRVFKSEIESKLDVLQEEQAKKLDAGSLEKYNLYKTKSEKDKIEIDKKRTVLLERINELNTAVTKATDTKKAEMRDPLHHGVGKVALALQADESRAIEERDKEVPKLETQIAQLDAESKTINSEIDKEMAEKTANHTKSQTRAANIDGLGKRIELAHELFPVSSVILMLLLIIIEVTPIFIKMMFVRGPYDLLVENQNRIVNAKYGIEERPVLDSDSELSPLGVVEPKFHQAKVIEEYEKASLAAERELSKTAQEAFVKKTKEDIEKNPENYFIEKN